MGEFFGRQCNQLGQLDRNQVTRVFRRADNNLDHRQMVCSHMNAFLKFRIFRFVVLLTRCEQKTTQVMFPVLENNGNNGSETAGHYYLLVLNLRGERFEVMDSMRRLGDKFRGGKFRIS